MPIERASVGALLRAVAMKHPTPGGGAVAALTAALGAALGQMVVNYSLGKKALAAHEAGNQSALDHLQQWADRAVAHAEADARAYARMNALWSLPKDDARRAREMPGAAREAIDVPAALLADCLDMLQQLAALCATTNRQLRSDLAIAAVLADAAARSAAWNIRVNLPMLGNEGEAAQVAARVDADVEAARRLATEIEHACA